MFPSPIFRPRWQLPSHGIFESGPRFRNVSGIWPRRPFGLVISSASAQQSAGRATDLAGAGPRLRTRRMASGLHPRCTCSTTRRWPTPPAHPPLGSRVSPLSHRPRARSPEQCCTAGQFCTVVPITLPTRIACLPSRSLESIRTRTSVFPALCGYESCPASPSPSVPCLKTVAPATRAMRQMQRHNIVNCSTAAADCAGEKEKKREREKKKRARFSMQSASIQAPAHAQLPQLPAGHACQFVNCLHGPCSLAGARPNKFASFSSQPPRCKARPTIPTLRSASQAGSS